jgi:hypothetical protein
MTRTVAGWRAIVATAMANLMVDSGLTQQARTPMTTIHTRHASRGGPC